MMANSSFAGSYKKGQDNKLSQFYTPDVLAKYTAKLANELADPETVILDPCVGGGALYKKLRPPKLAADIFIGNFPTAKQQDFLDKNVTRETYTNPDKLLICMNPPFTVKKKPTGVLDFLTQAEKLLKNGEYVVSIAGLKDRQASIMVKIPTTLHLLEEHIITKPIEFLDVVENKQKPLLVCVQVWQKQRSEQARPPMYPEIKNRGDFYLANIHHNYPTKNAHPDVQFYIKTAGSAKTNGMVEEKENVRINTELTNWHKDGIREGMLKTFRGIEKIYSKKNEDTGIVKINVLFGKSITSNVRVINNGTKGRSGTFAAVVMVNKTPEKVKEVKDKLKKVFESGVYKEWAKFRKTGNNPSLTFVDIQRAYQNKLKPFLIGKQIYLRKQGEQLVELSDPLKTETQHSKKEIKNEKVKSKSTPLSDDEETDTDDEEDVVFLKTESAGSSGKREGEEGKVSDKRKKRPIEKTEIIDLTLYKQLLKKWGVVSYKNKLKF